MKKYILYGLGGFIALAGIGLVVLYLRLGIIIKYAIERFAPQVTQTEVSVGLVKISPFSGSGSISSLKIGNPKGYKAKNAFELGKIEVEVDLKSLRSDHIVVKKVIVEKPVVHFEGNLLNSNLKQIQKNAEDFSGPSPKTKNQEPVKVEIRLFQMREGKVTVDLVGIKGAAVPVPLPPIELRDIGKKSGGATGAEVTKAVIGSLTKTALKAVLSGTGTIVDKTGVKNLLKGIFKKK